MTFNNLHASYADSLLAYLAKFLGDYTLAEDVAQQAWARAYESRDRFQSHRRFKPWLFAIARNCAIDAQRANGRKFALPLLDHFDPADTRTNDPETAEQAARIRELFPALPDDERATITLIYVRGLTFSEAARELGVPLGSVKTRAYRGLRSLRKQLNEKAPRRRVPGGALTA